MHDCKFGRVYRRNGWAEDGASRGASRPAITPLVYSRRDACRECDVSVRFNHTRSATSAACITTTTTSSYQPIPKSMMIQTRHDSFWEAVTQPVKKFPTLYGTW